MAPRSKKYGCTFWFTSEAPLVIPAELAKELQLLISGNNIHPTDLHDLYVAIHANIFLTFDPVRAELFERLGEWLYTNEVAYTANWDQGLIPIDLS